jgi:hypothetical protein
VKHNENITNDQTKIFASSSWQKEMSMTREQLDFAQTLKIRDKLPDLDLFQSPSFFPKSDNIPRMIEGYEPRFTSETVPLVVNANSLSESSSNEENVKTVLKSNNSSESSSELVNSMGKMSLKSGYLPKTTKMSRQHLSSFARLWDFIEGSLTPQSFSYLGGIDPSKNESSATMPSMLGNGLRNDSTPTLPNTATHLSSPKSSHVRQTLFTESLLRTWSSLKKTLKLDLRIEDEIIALIQTCHLAESCLTLTKTETFVYLFLLLKALSAHRRPELSTILEGSNNPLDQYCISLSIDTMQYQLLCDLFCK